MTRLSLLLLLSLPFTLVAAPPPWETLTEGLPFVLPTKVHVQGWIHTLPDSAQEQYFLLLRRALSKIHAYGETLTGNHLFRWPQPQGRFAIRELQFYFSDQPVIHMHFPREPVMTLPALRGPGLRGAVRTSPRGTGYFYTLQFPMDHLIYQRPDGRPNEFAFLNAATSLAGHLYGDLQAFLELNYPHPGSPEAVARRYRQGLEAVVQHSLQFLRWLKQQPGYDDYPAEQKASVEVRLREMAANAMRRHVVFDAGAMGCAGVASEN